MAFSRDSEKRSGSAVDILTDESAGLRIVVSRLGAELISLARRDADGAWRGFLYRDGEMEAPPKGWANHATVMGYFLHRLKNKRSLYRGREVVGGTHGFLRTKTWRMAGSAQADSLVYQMKPGDYSATEYPLQVGLTLSYQLRGDVLLTTFEFENHERDESAHLEFGLHPGFGASSFESFELQMPAGRYRRYFSPNNYLSGETKDFDFAGGAMPFRREDLPGSFILEFLEVPNRTFVFRDASSQRELELNMDEAPYVTLWSDGGAFLCIEPCWGLTDREDQRPFEEKDGIQVIPPGQRLRASFQMTPRILMN